MKNELSERILTCECIECGHACPFSINLILTVENRFLSQELKGRMLWEAYFQEFPDEDFKSDNFPRWKQRSLDTNRHIFFSQNQISIMDAVGSVFNVNNMERPAWKRRYLHAYQHWITNFPNLNHQSILINAASEMGIEHIRYHSSSEIFVLPERIYFKIVENSRVQSVESPQQLNESIIYKTSYGINSTEFSKEELIDLVRGINFIGYNNWKDILENPGLKFSRVRTESSLKLCYFELEKHFKVISFGARYYRVLPGFELKCVEPIPTFEHLNEVTHQQSPLTSQKSKFRVRILSQSNDQSTLKNTPLRTNIHIDSSVSTPMPSNDFTFNEEVIKSIIGNSSTSSVLPDGEIEEELIDQSLSTDNYVTTVSDQIQNFMADKADRTQNSVGSSNIDQRVLDVVDEFMYPVDAKVMIQKLVKIPKEYQENFRYSEFTYALPRRWRGAEHWKSIFNRLVKNELISINVQRRIKRNF